MTKVLTVGLALCLTGVTVAWQKTDAPEFQDEQQYRERMQEIDHSFAEIQKHGLVGGGPEVEREAGRLARVFEKVETFWEGRGNEEAAGFARMAKEGAEAALEASRKREQKALETAMKTLAASCEGCHREPLDKYRFRAGAGQRPR